MAQASEQVVLTGPRSVFLLSGAAPLSSSLHSDEHMVSWKTLLFVKESRLQFRAPCHPRQVVLAHVWSAYVGFV